MQRWTLEFLARKDVVVVELSMDSCCRGPVAGEEMPGALVLQIFSLAGWE